MATVFLKTNLSSQDMLKILQMKMIYDPTVLRTLSPANVMTLGELMEDMATVANNHGANGLQVIKGLSKYADVAVDGAGNINSSYWDFFGPIIHGRRAEIEFLAKNADAVPGTHVAFEVVKKEAKKLSDVDAFLNGAAVSIKRQGKTLDRWVKDRGEDWVKKYMTKVRDGSTVNGVEVLPSSRQMAFYTCNGAPDEATKALLKRIGEPIFGPGNVIFKDFPIKPPPAF